MKALSLRPAWAWAVIHAGKDVENRAWYTQYRGSLAIHASSNFTGVEQDAARIEELSGIKVPSFAVWRSRGRCVSHGL